MIKKAVEVLTNARKEKNISQEKVAAALGITRSYLAQVESNRRTPSWKLVKAISIFLDQDISTLLSLVDFEEARELVKKGQIHQVRTPELILSALRGARKSLDILGINSLGPLHQGRDMIIDLLGKGGRVRVCILNLDSEGFEKREKDECFNIDTGELSPRLREEYKASIGILKDIEIFKKSGYFQVRLYNHYPLCSLIQVDKTMVQYNPYTKQKSRWDEANVSVSRGLLSPVLICTSGDKKDFKMLTGLYRDIWENAEPLRLRTS